jgi:hypothetical protein
MPQSHTATEHRTVCTVAVERNRYGAMTLRSDRGRTYQIVGSADTAVQTDLDKLGVGSRLRVTLTKAQGRGNSWWVTAVEPRVDSGARNTTDRQQPPINP